MEGNEKPIDFVRLLNHIRGKMASQCREERSLTGEQVEDFCGNISKQNKDPYLFYR